MFTGSGIPLLLEPVMTLCAVFSGLGSDQITIRLYTSQEQKRITYITVLFVTVMTITVVFRNLLPWALFKPQLRISLHNRA